MIRNQSNTETEDVLGGCSRFAMWVGLGLAGMAFLMVCVGLTIRAPMTAFGWSDHIPDTLQTIATSSWWSALLALALLIIPAFLLALRDHWRS